MSELTSCNYCKWRELKRRYPKARLTADPLKDQKGRPGIGFPGGVRAVDKDGTDLGHWFAEMTDHCVC